VGDSVLNAIGFDSSRGIGKHDFVKSYTDEELALAETVKAEEAAKAALMERRLNDSRALIFKNLLNGVSIAQVAKDFRKSEPDVMNIFRYILRKIKSRRLERMEPMIVGNSISEIRRQRVTVLSILPKLNLDRDPLYKDVFHEPMQIKDDGTIRNADVLSQMKPLPEHLRVPPIAKP